MYFFKNKLIAISLMFFITSNVVFAKNSIEFFASNNTQEINLQTAYDRLMGPEEEDLQNNIIDVLQQNHLEQGKFTDILGTYKMSSDQKITGDNSERFETSDKQFLPDEKAFSIAKELAIKLKQESIAVFIPHSTQIGHITVNFVLHQPTINELVNRVNSKLPAIYSQAFSLHLMHQCAGFENAKVNSIEWLGSKIHLEDIQKAFPEGKVSYDFGDAYLVFQNGQKEPL